MACPSYLDTCRARVCVCVQEDREAKSRNLKRTLQGLGLTLLTILAVTVMKLLVVTRGIEFL